MKQIPEEFAQWSTISIIVQQIANKAIGMGSCKQNAIFCYCELAIGIYFQELA